MSNLQSTLKPTKKANKAITRVLLKALEKDSPICDMPTKFMLRVITLTHASNFSLKEINKRTGIPYSWLLDFSQGNICNPSVNRIVGLYSIVKEPIQQEDTLDGSN